MHWLLLVSRAVVLPFALVAVGVAALWVRWFARPASALRLVWGPVPILNNKYWSDAMKQCGFDSQTFMSGYYASINRRHDFDRYVEELVAIPNASLQKAFNSLFGPYVAFISALFRYDVFHHPYSGGLLGSTALWRWEAQLLHAARKFVVVIPYGADAYPYSLVADTSLRHALLLSYPEASRREAAIRQRMDYWVRQADIIINGQMLDATARWDVLPVSPVCVDTAQWPYRSATSADGVNAPVRVVHAPNHRGFKGTEFLIRAVADLQAEGLKVELILTERVQNEELRRVLTEEADILAEQFVVGAYGLNAIEGMASALPVLSNLDHEMLRVFRRYSYLDECPIVSTTPETLRDNLRRLVTDPYLRAVLGRAGRQYVQKYHSYEAAQLIFGSIYRKLGGEDVDLLNLFHPLKSEYVQRTPVVVHPLVQNHLPPRDAGANVHSATRESGPQRPFIIDAEATR